MFTRKRPTTPANRSQVFPEETIVLYPASGVEGVAVLEDGTPLADGKINLNAEYGEGRTAFFSLQTDAEGAFRTVDQVPATTVNLSISVRSGDWDGPSDLSGSLGPIEFRPDNVTDLGPLVLSAEP